MQLCVHVRLCACAIVCVYYGTRCVCVHGSVFCRGLGVPPRTSLRETIGTALEVNDADTVPVLKCARAPGRTYPWSALPAAAAAACSASRAATTEGGGRNISVVPTCLRMRAVEALTLMWPTGSCRRRCSSALVRHAQC
jgi:hypothetical protein